MSIVITSKPDVKFSGAKEILNIIPVSDLRQGAAKIMKQLRNIREPLAITQRGRATAVIISVEACEKSEYEKEILRRIEDFPISGRMIPEFPDHPFREIIVAPYRFFYKIKADSVWIVFVWHGAQLPKEPAG